MSYRLENSISWVSKILRPSVAQVQANTVLSVIRRDTMDHSCADRCRVKCMRVYEYIRQANHVHLHTSDWYEGELGFRTGKETFRVYTYAHK